jgi:hypothetical protein
MDIKTLNQQNLKLIEGDYINIDDITDKIYEDGHVFEKDQFMTFDYEGKIIQVGFNTSASGSVSEDPGDYWTPPTCDVDISDLEIEVTDITVDEEPTELTKDILVFFEKFIEKILQ